MKLNKIRAFRKIVRKFERGLNDHLKNNTSCIGVSLPQCHTILEIEEQGETTIGRLATSLGLDNSTLSRTIDGLFNIGLVKRFPHQSDRRFMSITLTKQGQAMCNKINKANDEYYDLVFQAIPVEKQNIVIESFGLFTKAMATRRTIENRV